MYICTCMYLYCIDGESEITGRQQCISLPEESGLLVQCALCADLECMFSYMCTCLFRWNGE